MRPDCSLLIRPDAGSGSVPQPVWLHFDAKYRVDTLRDVLPDQPATRPEAEGLATEVEEAEERGEATRSDLLKMHAYRDAIRRSAGAYVLYPGTENSRRPEYHELLPGLGAFALTPSANGDAAGSEALSGFLAEVFTHVASQVTQHERGRYWNVESFGEASSTAGHALAAPFLTRPPADTPVLLGFVRGAEHLGWIRRQRLYNIRADDRTGRVSLTSSALGAELLVLYEPRTEVIEVWTVGGSPELATKSRLELMGYPGPRGQLYFCLPLADLVSDSWAGRLTLGRVLDVRRRVAPEAEWGEPVPTTWFELVR
jgi:hypothetical protein